MKILITVEGNKVTVEIDSKQLELPLESTTPNLPGLRNLPPDKPVAPSTDPMLPGTDRLNEFSLPERGLDGPQKPSEGVIGCVYCRKRGAPCVRHGGERSGVYTPKHRTKPASTDIPDQPEPKPTWHPHPILPGTPEYAKATAEPGRENYDNRDGAGRL